MIAILLDSKSNKVKRPDAIDEVIIGFYKHLLCTSNAFEGIDLRVMRTSVQLSRGN